MAERGEYRAVRRVLLDGPDFQKLSANARWVFVAACIASETGGATKAGIERLTGLCSGDAAVALSEIAARGWATCDGGRVTVPGLSSAPLGDRRRLKSLRAHIGWPEPNPGIRPPTEEWVTTRARILARDKFTCAYCGTRGGQLECDHVIPVSRGGAHDDDNLATACRRCNRSKGNSTPEEWKETAYA